MWDQVISLWMNEEDMNAIWIELLWHQKKFPCMQTCRRWIRQYQGEGHTCRRRPTDNHFSKREVHGQDLVNLAIYWTVWPKVYIDEVRACVHNRNPANPPYSWSQTGRAELRLGLHRTAASTTSGCAYLQVNLQKQVIYCNAAFLDRVSGESMRDVIDIDESNYFKIESQNWKFGKVTWERRCDARGKYKKGAGSVSLLMAISGD